MLDMRIQYANSIGSERLMIGRGRCAGRRGCWLRGLRVGRAAEVSEAAVDLGRA